MADFPLDVKCDVIAGGGIDYLYRDIFDIGTFYFIPDVLL